MKFAFYLLLFILSIHQYSADRTRRQIRGYSFPGPRRETKPVLNPEYSSGQYPNRYVEKPQYEEEDLDQSVRSAGRQAASYRPENSNEYINHNYRSSPSYSNANNYEKPDTSSYISQPKVESYGQNALSPGYLKEKTKEEEEEEEEEKTPTKLEVLLASSKFTCVSKKDGYYADESVNCQVFHYCVAGIKHSWMCPENTVFHQIHLNCVPANQDICSQSEKFYIVNEYLHKLIDDKGPNNTLRYHQRYYPEEFLGEVVTQPYVQSFGGPQIPPKRQRQSIPHASYNNYPESFSNEERTYVRRQLSKPPSFLNNQVSYQPQPVPHTFYKKLLQPEKQYTGLNYLSSSSSSSGSSYNPTGNSVQDSSSYSRSQTTFAPNSRAQSYSSDSPSSNYPSSLDFNLYKHSFSSASSSPSNSETNYDSNSYSQNSPNQSNPKSSTSYPAYPPYLSTYTSPDSLRGAERRAERVSYKKFKPNSLKPVDLSKVTYEEDY